MMKKIIIGVGVVGLIALSILTYDLLCVSKLAYVDVPKVFSQFDMKKEMQLKFNETEKARKRVLDSLTFDLQMLSRKLKSNPSEELSQLFEVNREYFFKNKARMEEDNAALSSQYDKQILERMSQYIADFCKKNHYDMVYGADGNGTLMYADESYNISEDVIAYINNRYKGIE